MDELTVASCAVRTKPDAEQTTKARPMELLRQWPAPAGRLSVLAGERYFSSADAAQRGETLFGRVAANLAVKGDRVEPGDLALGLDPRRMLGG